MTTSNTLTPANANIPTTPVEHKINYPVVAIVGSSGTGKSFSMRHLPPEDTFIFNFEEKYLPFREHLAFNPYSSTNLDAMETKLSAVMNDPKYKYVVVDSFTKYAEILMNYAKMSFKGYDIFNVYSDRIWKLLQLLKKNNGKYVFVIATSEIVAIEQPSGAKVNNQRIAVQGKVWEGKIEKEFTLVLFTDVRRNKDNKHIDYTLVTNNDGTSSAKSPFGMFEEERVPNDLLVVAKTMKDYFGLAY